MLLLVCLTLSLMLPLPSPCRSPSPPPALPAPLLSPHTVPNQHFHPNHPTRSLRRYGFQPHRIALWIYWQALVLLRKGVPFHGPPDPGAYRRQAEQCSRHPRTGGGSWAGWCFGVVARCGCQGKVVSEREGGA